MLKDMIKATKFQPYEEYMAALNGPRTLAVAVSVTYVIRSIVDLGANPPANHPSVLFPAPAKYPLPSNQR